MTLIIRDEGGDIISEANPVITEHNGTLGDTVLLSLTLENISKKHFHRDVVIQVNSSPPIEVDLNLPGGPTSTIYAPRIDIRRINPLDKVNFILRSTVKADTPEQVVAGTVLQVSSIRFPFN